MSSADYRRAFQAGLGNAAQCLGAFMDYGPDRRTEVWRFLVSDAAGLITTVEFTGLTKADDARNAAVAHIAAKQLPPRDPPVEEYQRIEDAASRDPVFEPKRPEPAPVEESQR